MITCEFCGTQAEQHDHWRHEIMARVAALEDVVTRDPAPPVEAQKHCEHGVPSHLGCWNCTSHAVKIGDVVMDDPHAEQPSRKETGGGEAICGHGNDEDCPDCFWALQRDRAQAEAAEQSALLDAAWAARHPLAETPAPAVGTLLANATVTCGYCGEYGYLGLDHWERCAKHPAHAKLAQAERERDELGRQVEQMAAHVSKMRMELDEAVERLKCEACTDAKSILCATCIDREERDATARERERCLAWYSQWETTGMTRDYRDAGIRSGKPAPGTDNPDPKCDPDPPREVAPDRTRTGSVAPKDIACPTCAMGRGDCCVEDGVFWPEQVHATRYFEAKRRR